MKSLFKLKGQNQNWIQIDETTQRIILPGGSTCGDVSSIASLLRHFAYISSDQDAHAGTLLDLGCGVASVDAELMSNTTGFSVNALGIAPIDQHSGQTNIVTERGVPLLIGAITPVVSLPIPMGVTDLVYCCWCRLSGDHVSIQISQILKVGGHFIMDSWGEHEKKLGLDEPEKFCLSRVSTPDVLQAKGQVKMVVFRRQSKEECKNTRKEHSIQWCKTDIPLAPILQNCIPDGLPVADSRASSDSIDWIFERVSSVFLDSARVLLVGDDGTLATRVSQTSHKAITVVSDLTLVATAFQQGFVGYQHDWCYALPNNARAYDVIIITPNEARRLLLHMKSCKGGSLERATEGLMREVLRVLRPGGALYIYLPLDDITTRASSIVKDMIMKYHWLNYEEKTVTHAVELKVL